MASKEKDPSKDKVIQFQKGKDKKAKKETRKFTWVQIFTMVILAIIVVTFVFSPVAGNIAGNAGSVVFGQYGKKKIEYRQGNYFATQVERMNEYYRGAYGDNVEFERQLIWRSAFNETVIHTAIMSEIEEAGGMMSEETLNRILSYYPGYRDENGFSTALYNSTPASERYNIRQRYEADLLHQLYLEDVFTREKVSPEEADFLSSFNQEEKSFEFVVWEYQDYPDSEVVAFAQENAPLFQQRELSRITAATEKEAQALLTQLDEGTATFAELAQSSSTDSFSASAGEMGVRFFHEISTDFVNTEDAQALFTLEEGTVSPAYEAPFGWTIYQVNKTLDNLDVNTEEGLNTVRSYLTRNEKGKIEDYLVTTAEAAKATYGSLEEAAQGLNKELNTSESFPLNYGNSSFITKKVGEASDHPVFQSLTYSDSFFEKAYLLDTDEVSEPIITGGYVALFSPVSEVIAEDSGLSITEAASQISRVKQQDFQSAVMGSELLKDNFYSTLASLFSEQ